MLKSDNQRAAKMKIFFNQTFMNYFVFFCSSLNFSSLQLILIRMNLTHASLKNDTTSLSKVRLHIDLFEHYISRHPIESRRDSIFLRKRIRNEIF